MRFMGVVLGSIAVLKMFANNREPLSMAVLFVPMFLVWYAEEIGSFTGPILRGGFVTKETPAWMIAAVGYAWLIALIAE